jgi:hypothetical protein
VKRGREGYTTRLFAAGAANSDARHAALYNQVQAAFDRTNPEKASNAAQKSLGS